MELNSSLTSNNGTAVIAEQRSVVVTVLFLVFYTVVLSTAIIGNFLVILAVYKFPSMRTVVNLFLANLATSDFLFAVVSLFDTVAYMLGGWFAGEASCKVQSYLIEVFYTCSILTLVAVSFERYLAICKPHLKSRSRKQTFIVIAITWLVSVGFCSVLLYAYRIRMKSDVPICENLQWSHSDRRVFYTIHSLVVYLVPLSIMIWAHHKISRIITKHKIPGSRPIVQQSSDTELSRNGCELSQTTVEEKKESNELSLERGVTKLKRAFSRRKTTSKYKNMRGRRKVIKILITVTVMFFLLWTPFIIIRMLLYYGLNVHVYIWKATQLLILSSTAVNGLIYALMSPQFRKCFKKLLPCFLSEPGDGDTTASRAREMNSFSNSASAPVDSVKTRTLPRSFHITKSCM